MDLVKTYQKRLQDGIAAVEHDITARTQQIEGLTKRLEWSYPDSVDGVGLAVRLSVCWLHS
jgi:hypothetical protein